MRDSSQSYIRIERPEPIIRADSIAHVVFERRDVATMSRFLEDFGLIALESRDDVHYFRGYADQPYCVAISPSNVDRLARITFEGRNSFGLEKIAENNGGRLG